MSSDYDELVIYGKVPNSLPRARLMAEYGHRPTDASDDDDEVRYAANERGRVDAEVLRSRGVLFTDPGPENLGSPVPHGEPPIYTVISFRIRHPGEGRVYDYAAIRAGDGKWYPTGGETRQGVDWPTLVRAVRARLVGPISVLGPVRQVFV